ncbi:hypothetical protein K503DRAFT_774201 [Rhizopogon vinicolor AM-OR11-026]|uniref:Uncharacterized protein n=1 Tax=Rhizopogon vinicolor AM-OR11-026 TaxID=1314800 RepID=A0A1B7MQA3_9AGAM|nr:hypothetical protein K503DRAFT_774201 [Rhizopogon vinicolor AM-OR11-026]
MKTSPAGKLAVGIEYLWAPLHHSLILMQEVCRRKLSSALLPYGAERLIRGGIFHPATTPLCVAHTCLILVHMDACNYYHADAHIPLPWMPAILLYADAHKLLPWTPAILPHVDARILLPRMPANPAHTEGGDFTNSVYRSFLASHSTSCFLTSMCRWTCLPAPTILGIRGSLRCVISLLISWESQLTSAHLLTGWGRYRGRDPFGGSAQIATCILPMQTFSHRTRHNSATQSQAVEHHRVTAL